MAIPTLPFEARNSANAVTPTPKPHSVALRGPTASASHPSTSLPTMLLIMAMEGRNAATAASPTVPAYVGISCKNALSSDRNPATRNTHANASERTARAAETPDAVSAPLLAGVSSTSSAP